MNELLYTVWLSLACTPGSDTFAKLLSKFSSPRDVYSADSSEIAACIGSRSRDYNALIDKNTERAERIVDFCTTKHVGILNYFDRSFPDSLKRIKNPPVLLYYRGILPDFDREFSLAVVGSRKITTYGRKNTFTVSHDLARAGAMIVSGMATGTDGVALAAALSTGRPVVAVLGSGIDVCYPMHHRNLAREIVKVGCVMTEYAPGTKPKRRNFPIRNRIISGLCRATLVIEGNTNSGSMLTAREAIRQGRDIFAIPGNVGISNALGTNVLIRDGARVALSARDIIGIRGDRGIDLDRLADAELNSTLDINTLKYYGVSPAAYIAEPAPREEIGRLEPLPEKKPARRQEKKKPEPEITEEPKKSSLAPLPDGVMKDIYESMPVGTPVSADFFAGLGILSGDLVGHLSMLEVMGYITSAPGGTYLREI